MDQQEKLEQLERTILNLQTEVADRERDLAFFRAELSRANDRLEKLIGQMSQELRLAQQIHRVLVPTEFPHIPGFEFSIKFVPSLYSGGDYVDIFEHEDRFRFGMLLASSSGHAMSGLFLSVLLKLSGRMEARRGAEPQKILDMLAQELLPHVQQGDSAELFYGVIDRRSYECAYVKTKGLIGVFQMQGGEDLKVLESQCESISPMFKGGLSSQVINLNPRDRLIFCSRGIIETQNMDGEAFGQERLFKAILAGPRQGVHELRNHILYETQNFASGQEVKRDQTIVVVEVKDRVIKLAKSR